MGFNPPIVSTTDIWDIQSHEPPKSFHAFCHFRDLGLDRSIDKAWLEHQNRCLHVTWDSKRRATRNWWARSSDWGWVVRARAWDKYQDQLALAKLAKGQAEARERHAKMANAALQTLLLPSRLTLEALQDASLWPELLKEARKSPAHLLRLVELVAQAARSIPGLVQIERLSLGLTTEHIEIEDGRGDDTFASRVRADPEAQALAFSLLDRVAGSGVSEGAAERLRLLGESGEVEASAASEPADEEAD
jgi:hypothetical protein